MKILVVFTGGTIGSTISEGYAVPDDDKKYKLISMYEKSIRKYTNYKTKEKIEFEMESPYQELSENNTCRQIFKLASYLNEKVKSCVRLSEKYDGIIVTHGTDTLQYTAAALGYIFGDIDIPIVLVSSNYVLEDKRANGLTNFVYAVKFIEGRYGKGIFVSYCNTDKEPMIHRGTRLMEHAAYSDDVYSIKDSAYGYFKEDLFVKTTRSLRDADEFEKTTEKCSEIRNILLEEKYSNDVFSDIVLIKPFPGMRYNEIPAGTKAILHMTYHSGTICSKSPDIEQFAKDVEEKNIPVYIIGAGDSVDYDSVKIYEKLGFEVLPIAALPAITVKLWFACKMFSKREEISEFMMKDISGDINLKI